MVIFHVFLSKELDYDFYIYKSSIHFAVDAENPIFITWKSVHSVLYSKIYLYWVKMVANIEFLAP